MGTFQVGEAERWQVNMIYVAKNSDQSIYLRYGKVGEAIYQGGERLGLDNFKVSDNLLWSVEMVSGPPSERSERALWAFSEKPNSNINLKLLYSVQLWLALLHYLHFAHIISLRSAFRYRSFQDSLGGTLPGADQIQVELQQHPGPLTPLRQDHQHWQVPQRAAALPALPARAEKRAELSGRVQRVGTGKAVVGQEEAQDYAEYRGKL